MKARGKILRVATSDPGLVMIDGQQFHFSTGGVWRSEVRPRPGLDVEVELDNNLQVTGMTVIPDSQVEDEHAQRIAERETNANKVSHKLFARFAVMALIVATLCFLGWFFLKH